MVLVWPADGPEPTHSLRGEGLVGVSVVHVAL